MCCISRCVLVNLKRADWFYLCLNHVWSMQSHPVHKGINSHCFFVLELLKKHIQGYNGARPPDSSTGTQEEPEVRIAVHARWTLLQSGLSTCSEPRLALTPLQSACAVSPGLWTGSDPVCSLGLRGQARLWSESASRCTLERCVSVNTHSFKLSFICQDYFFFPKWNQHLFLHVSVSRFSESSWSPPARILWWPAAPRTDKACSLQASIFHT